MARTPKQLRGTFQSRFRGYWLRQYVVLALFSVLFILPVLIFVLSWLLTAFTSFDLSGYVPFVEDLRNSDFSTQAIIISILSAAYLLFFLPAGLMLLSAPRVLAPIALGLIDRMDLNFLLFVPLGEGDYSRNKFMEFMAGVPVGDARINASLRERIQWLSGQMKPEALHNGIPLYLAGRWPGLPTTLTNMGHPVGRLGKIVLRQWYFYTAQGCALATCCSPGCLYLSCCGMAIFGAIYYRFILSVHSLAYSAAYLKLLTDKWPWER